MKFKAITQIRPFMERIAPEDREKFKDMMWAAAQHAWSRYAVEFEGKPIELAFVTAYGFGFIDALNNVHKIKYEGAPGSSGPSNPPPSPKRSE